MLLPLWQRNCQGDDLQPCSAGKYARTVADSEDDESFAEEQLQKAIRRNQGRDASTSAPAGMYNGAAGAAGAAMAAAPMSRTRMDQVKLAGEGVVQALQQALQRAQLSHKQAQRNLEKTSHNLTDSLQSIETIRQDIQKMGDKYTFVQQMKAYIADLCDCLSHKAALVEELEDHLQEIREEQAAAEQQQKQVRPAAWRLLWCSG